MRKVTHAIRISRGTASGRPGWSKRCHPALAIVAGLSLALGSGKATHAQGASPSRQSHAAVGAADDMTHDLVALSESYQGADPTTRKAMVRDLLDLAVSREQLLKGIAESDPSEVLRLAMPSDIRAVLPPEVQSHVEEEVEAEGVLQVLIEDLSDGSRALYGLETATEHLSLHFATDPPGLQSGSRVRVRGVRLDNTLALQSGGGSVQTLSATATNTFGEQRTLVILVNFQDKATQPYSLAYAQSETFTNTSNFMLENSYRQTWLTGAVYGWFTIPVSSTVCDTAAIESYAQAAASAAGANLSAYSRYIYAFPQNACTFWGRGTVGGVPSHAWINGSYRVLVVAHEFGHNLGLYHSHSLDCGSTSIGSNCVVSEYGDVMDMMGNPPNNAHYNTFQKEQIGWLNYGTSPPIATVSVNGVYAVDPAETGGPTATALKIVKSTDSNGFKTWYYIEVRRPVGFDSFLSSNANVMGGVLMHTGTQSSPNSSYLLDMTPATSSWSDPALVVGQSFYDPAAGVTIAPLSVGSSGATVQVTFDPVPCVQANPTVAVSPGKSAWVMPGTAVPYTVSVTNNDSSGCTASTFNLQSAVPSGWTGVYAAPNLSVAPGANGSTTLQVASPTSASDGAYTFTAAAKKSANTAYSGSSSAIYDTASSLTVAVSTDKSTYSRGNTVSITARLTASTTVISGVGVTFTITKPNGSVVVQNATTGTDGSARVSWRSRKQDPAGLYQVRASASLTSGVSGSGTTSFTLQ